MDWNDSRLLDSMAWDLVLGDYPRGLNRARIQNLANGDPPYSELECEENNVEVNVSDLSHTCKMHEGRSQFQSALLKTGNSFVARTDWPAQHRRSEIGSIATLEANRPMRRSIKWFERQRAKTGLIILHGISPGVWENEDRWCSRPLGVSDVLIPSDTELGFENLPLFILRRSFTAVELLKLTEKDKRDTGWNMGLIERIRKWLDSQLNQLRSTNYPEIWSPEKVEERKKSDTGYYLGDAVPTIEAFDCYAFTDEGKESGWIRRMILNSWGQPFQSGVTASGKPQYSMNRRSDRGDLDRPFGKGDFLFTSGKRKVARSWQNVIAFQFADLSAVFPAKYHSTRSLGWLLYAACHIGMRMRCRFYESVFEALMQQFKVTNMDDAQRALKMNLVSRGFIDETLKPIPASERWQVNSNLVELGLRDNQQVISENSASFTQNQNYSRDRTEKTKYQVQAEIGAVTSLVGVALNQAYQYEAFEAREIFRRMLKKNSSDPDVIQFRANCLKRGIPEKYLVYEAWDIEVERTVGQGNKSMELTIAQWLMENQERYDPDAQRTILRDATLAVTDNPDKARELVPEEPQVSNSTHDAQLTAGSLLAGLPVSFKSGVNHQEYAAALLASMRVQINKITQRGGVANPDELAGLQNIAGQTIQGQPIQGNNAMAHIQVLLKNEESKQVAKALSDMLAKNLNEVRAMAQRLQEMMQKRKQAGNGQMDPKDVAKIKAIETQAAVKAKNAQQSHAQKTAQRQIAFEEKIRQDRQQHAAELASKDLETASTIHRNRLSSTTE